MTLNERIALLRKQRGWSQEELADRVGVSRQAVSKWESDGAQPDLDKILLLSALFEVTTDYLLKGDCSDTECVKGEAVQKEDDTAKRRVTYTQAVDYMQRREKASPKMALATYLCILSPICLLLLIGFTELEPSNAFLERMGVLTGIVTLLLFVAAAVVLFVICAMDVDSYAFLDREAFVLDTGAKSAVESEKSDYRKRYVRHHVLGVCLCVVSPIPLLIGAFLDHPTLLMALLCGTLALAGAGVFLFVLAGTRWGSFQRLLREGDFSEENRKKEKWEELVSSVYWLAVTAVYLAWSFLTAQWGRTWIVWPVAGVAFAVVSVLLEFFAGKKEADE